MAATHYGLGLHGDRVNELDSNYPSNLSNAFKVCQLMTHVFDLYLRSLPQILAVYGES
jgi:hypothetical protein